MTLTLTELATKLTLLCGQCNLAYDLTHQPMKVGPDCYMFYATELDYSCRKEGKCKQSKYYALTGGERIDIIDELGFPIT